MGGNKKLRKKTKSESKTYQTTDNDECTVSPSSHGMPKVYDTDAAVSSASSKSISSLSSFLGSGEESSGRMKKARRERSKSPDHLLVSMTAAAAKAKEKYDNPPGYEIVKISKLENPPVSFTHRRSPRAAASSNNIDSPKEQVIYRCKYPSDLSSLQTPSSSNVSQDSTSTDGVYENLKAINYLKKSKKYTSSSTSVNTAHNKSDAKSERNYRRRRNASNNIEDLYMGPMTRRDSEKHVRRNTQFRLYHRIPSKASQHLDYLKDHISLYVVYKSTQGDYHHYPIQRCRGPGGAKQYYIDCGENDRMVFNTLDALVTYYSVYVRFDTNDETAEVFPSKHRIRERKSAREAESARERESIREEKSPCDVESTREEDDEAESKSKRKREKRKKKQSEIYY
uniref:SH2 domain-containing protein n=1 Tax=Panagrolaimus sp. PS1159 TaxID=55785 RepID=A0AC35GQ02_9BILA